MAKEIIHEWWDLCMEYPSYEISSHGRIRNHRTKKYLAMRQDESGYVLVNLEKKYNSKWKTKTIRLHRLIAERFVNNSQDYDEINHINGNKRDNTCYNLEWCSRKQNTTHVYKNLNKKRRRQRPVCQYDRKGNFLKKYNSLKDAEKSLNVKKSHISCCARGKRPTAHGYVWKYVEEDEQPLTTDIGIENDNYPGYVIYDDGKIYSLNNKKFLLQQTGPNGAKCICIRIAGKTTQKQVHRLVAETYINNPNNYKYVMHIDGKNDNNRVDNLKWSSMKQIAFNVIKSGKNQTSKAVNQIKNDIIVNSFSSLRQANIAMNASPNSTNILNACKGKYETAYGYNWEYES